MYSVVGIGVGITIVLLLIIVAVISCLLWKRRYNKFQFTLLISTINDYYCVLCSISLFLRHTNSICKKKGKHNKNARIN